MPRLTAADEFFYHQIPEPLPNVAVRHEHWRESYYFGMHPPDGTGDAIILTMAHYPQREQLDSHQFGFIGGRRTFAHFARPYAGDPHTTAVGPISVEIVEPYRVLHLRGGGDAPVPFDVTFTARTQPYALRRGTMKARDEIIWDQSHFLQSGTWDGTYTADGVTKPIDGWFGQRDHSWGIREHARCPMWLWLAVQLPDAMLAVWHWEYANGARVFTDGCYAAADGSVPVPVIDFRHDLHWTDHEGNRADYGRDGGETDGLAGRVEFVLEGGRTIAVDGAGPRCASYGPFGGGQHLLRVQTDDGREGSAIYELTGASHQRYFPIARAERLPPDG
jgi:hypothetical protein